MDMNATRRQIMAGLAAMLSAPTLLAASPEAKGARKPSRLRIGDTVGLIEPASASDEPFQIQLVEEAIIAMGLKPKRAPHILNRYGYLAGADKDRAADVNAMFADKDVKAIFAVRGGWGWVTGEPLGHIWLHMRDQLKPLRLQNGLYIQRHAPMLRIAIACNVNGARLQRCWQTL